MSLDTWFLMLIFKTYCFLTMNYNKNKCEKIKYFAGKIRVFLQGFLSKSFRYYLSAKSFYLSFILILHIDNIRSLSKKILEISNKMWRPWDSSPISTDYKVGLTKLQ